MSTVATCLVCAGCLQSPPFWRSQFDQNRDDLLERIRRQGEEQREQNELMRRAHKRRDEAWRLRDEGKLDEAVAAYQESLELDRRLFGDDSLLVAASLRQLAEIYTDRNELDAAIDARREAAAIFDKLLPVND